MTDIEKAAELYANRYYNKSNDTNITSKESFKECFKEGASYAVDVIVNWLYEEASKYAVTLFNKDEFDVEVMINDLLKAIDEEEILEEE